jgi:AcrR family transcriptional regulator
MAKQKRDAKATKAKILTNARRLFSKQGFDATTVDDIAAESGVNKALVYYYFKNKSGLYSDVMSGLFDAIYDAIVEGEKECSNATEELEVFINSYASYAYKNPYFPALLLRELSDSGAHVPEMMFVSMRRVFVLLSDILKRGESQNIFSPSISMVVHFMIIGSINLMITTDPLRKHAIVLDENIDTCSSCSEKEVASYVFETIKKSLLIK